MEEMVRDLLIKAPRPFTRQAMYVYLHECRHVALGHLRSCRNSRHAEKFEAERWALERIRACGHSSQINQTCQGVCGPDDHHQGSPARREADLPQGGPGP